MEEGTDKLNSQEDTYSDQFEEQKDRNSSGLGSEEILENRLDGGHILTEEEEFGNHQQYERLDT